MHPPKGNVEFVACMEDIQDIYELPYNPSVPVVCMDEKPYQLLGETREPFPIRPGDDLIMDSGYVRNGTCSIFVFTEPLGGVRHVNVREQRTAVDWAEEIKYLADAMYPDAEKIILFMDNLNTINLLPYIKNIRHQKPEVSSKTGYTLYPKAWQLVKHGGNRAKCHDKPVPVPKNRDT